MWKRLAALLMLLALCGCGAQTREILSYTYEPPQAIGVQEVSFRELCAPRVDGGKLVACVRVKALRKNQCGSLEYLLPADAPAARKWGGMEWRRCELAQHRYCYTEVTAEVLEVFQGEAGAELTFAVLGGSARWCGRQVQTLAPGPELREGQTLLLLLRADTGSLHPAAGTLRETPEPWILQPRPGSCIPVEQGKLTLSDAQLPEELADEAAGPGRTVSAEAYFALLRTETARRQRELEDCRSAERQPLVATVQADADADGFVYFTVTGGTGKRIWRRAAFGRWKEILSPPDCTALDTGLRGGRSYTYKIVVFTEDSGIYRESTPEYVTVAVPER